MTSLCFLWHMHQPYYKDLWSGEYKLPWTRLHALKDYAGMVEILGEFPSIRQTFNLVPSMLAQIEEYAAGTASDPFLTCAEVPAENLTEEQRAFVRKYFFQTNEERLINRYPRYRELLDRRNANAEFNDADYRDLQVLSQLAWFDEDLLARDEELQELVRKGRDFTRDDQIAIIAKERAALGRVIPVYRDFAKSGQIEISTTPFYHPILPLLCDTEIARVANPDVALPTRFRYPEDAREQLRRARHFMGEKLGIAVRGLWPSEGSVSDDALALAYDAGFSWAASDNHVLALTIHREAGCDETYKAYRWQRGGRSLGMLFRDRYLSDLIGFEYSHKSAEEAAGHFLWRIRENTGGRDCVVPVILDGENAWEWYEANGRPFLRELYRRIEADPSLEAITVSEAIQRYPAEQIESIHAGSWIYANFNIWIGADEDNRAWELLREAREVYEARKDAADPAERDLAYEELLIAEGSDWFWWYGPEHASDNRAEFDELFRAHLAGVYRALGLTPPDNLFHPIISSGHSGEAGGAMHRTSSRRPS